MNDAEEIVEQLNALVEELENYPDSAVREKTLDLVQMILALHGEVLHRVLRTLDSFPQREQLLSQVINDEVVRAVLIIHGLAPDDLQTRVAAAVENLRPYLISQGCDVKLLTVENGRARMRLMRSGQGAPPILALKSEIENALAEAAPDLLGIEIEGVAEQIEATAKAAELLGSMISSKNGNSQPPKLVQIKRAKPAENRGGKWISVVRALGFGEGDLKIINYADVNLLVCKTDGDFYAYRNLCAAGGNPLDDATFESPMLVCSCHGYHYNLLRRGVCVENPNVRLESLPVKIEDDKVKVAL